MLSPGFGMNFKKIMINWWVWCQHKTMWRTRAWDLSIYCFQGTFPAGSWHRSAAISSFWYSNLFQPFTNPFLFYSNSEPSTLYPNPLLLKADLYKSGRWGLETAYSLPQFRHLGPKKNLNFAQFIQDFLSKKNLYESSNLSPSLSTCRLFGNHSLWQFQKTIEGFDCKINGLALGAALLHSQTGEHCRAQRQGVSKSAAVALATTGSLEEKGASTLAILTQFES